MSFADAEYIMKRNQTRREMLQVDSLGGEFFLDMSSGSSLFNSPSLLADWA